MCVVSMIQEHYTDKWNNPPGWTGTGTQTIQFVPAVPSAEEVAEFRKLLTRAREYDKKYSQPDCELEAKKELLRTMAEKWGIDISFIDKEETA